MLHYLSAYSLGENGQLLPPAATLRKRPEVAVLKGWRAAGHKRSAAHRLKLATITQPFFSGDLLQRIPLRIARLLIAAITLAFIIVAPAQAQQQQPGCSTICFRAPQYFLHSVNVLPRGLVLIAGNGFNYAINTGHAAQMQLALDGGNSAQDRFNQQFVAAQLSLLAAPGYNLGALQSPLTCSGLDFAPVRLNNGLIIDPNYHARRSDQRRAACGD